MINPHEDAMRDELLHLTEPLRGAPTNVQLIPRESNQLQSSLKIFLEAKRAASSDLIELYHDVSNGLKRIRMVATKVRNEARFPNTVAVNIPKGITNRFQLKQELSPRANILDSGKHLLRERRYMHDSLNAVKSHERKYLKEILHKHGEVLGDTTEMFELLAKCEESYLCEEEIYQAKMINLQFKIYVLRSRYNDFFLFSANVSERESLHI